MWCAARRNGSLIERFITDNKYQPKALSGTDKMDERQPAHSARRISAPGGGFTLLELIVAATILSILTLMALPLARVTIQREKERQLRRALWEMRDAIDKYKLAGERGAFQTKVDSGGYPPDLETLVKGVDTQGCQATGMYGPAS